MGILQLLSGLVSLANLFFQARNEGRAERFALALDRIKQLEKATQDEINKAIEARKRVDNDPHAGEL